MNDKKIIDMNEGWEFLQKGIKKLTNSLDGCSEPQFTPEECMTLYTTIYTMCNQSPSNYYCEQLYIKYREAYVEYINSTVLLSLRANHGEFMLRELVKRWENHKFMVSWLSFFFNYLDRFYTHRKQLPPLKEVGFTCFHDLVYKEVFAQARDIVIYLINKERGGEQIDRALVQNVVNIFIEIRKGNLDLYKRDFEEAMLKDTGVYYSSKASSWILQHSSMNYMLKVEECLKLEKERVAYYLHLTTEQKLLEKVRHEMFAVCSSQLLEELFARYART